MDLSGLYSANSKRFKASEIRELLEISQRPGVISFAGGLPNTHAFPVDEVKKIANIVLEEEGPRALQYGPTSGLREFREKIAEMMQKDGIHASIDNVFITVGSQQGLDLAGRVFLNRGDVVFLELPSYLGGINAFRSYGPKFVGVPLDNEGMNVDILEEKIKESKRKGETAKFIYTVPSFQNPAGVELSEERRKRMVDIAQDNNLLIIEDDPYGKLRFEGKPLKPIKTYDENVIYMATFSKILSPGLRVAYVVAPDDVPRKMVVAKQSVDLCTPTFTQLIAYHFMKNGFIEQHIPKIIEMYKRKRDIMLSALEEFFPAGCTWTHPNGGMFLWATLPEKIDTAKMVDEAIQNEKVAYVHGRAFYYNSGGSNAMRLNFSNPSDDNIREGIQRLAKVIMKRL
jgi:2-aminoadipate transaminase